MLFSWKIGAKLLENDTFIVMAGLSSLQQRVSLDQDQMVMGFLQSRSLKFLMRTTTTLNIIWGS